MSPHIETGGMLMSGRRISCALLLCLTLQVFPAAATELLPFYGTWEGVTLSATPTGTPGVILVISGGTGTATHLGAFEMVSPHLTYLATFQVEGTQSFVAANGDTLEATISGQFVPMPDGSLEATLVGVITGGTGLRAGATGSYAFHIVSRPDGAGFTSVATITGVISQPTN